MSSNAVIHDTAEEGRHLTQVMIEEISNGFVVRVTMGYREVTQGKYMENLDGLQDYIIARRTALSLGAK